MIWLSLTLMCKACAGSPSLCRQSDSPSLGRHCSVQNGRDTQQPGVELQPALADGAHGRRILIILRPLRRAFARKCYISMATSTKDITETVGKATFLSCSAPACRRSRTPDSGDFHLWNS